MDGSAVIFSEGAFGTREGKVANALVRYGVRYQVEGVLDSTHSGREARDVIEGVSRRIPIWADLGQALQSLERRPDFLVVGLSSDYGRLKPQFRAVIKEALKRGISVDSAVRPFLKEDAEFPGLAQGSGARIRTVGYPPPPSQLRDARSTFDNVRAFKVAVVGTCAGAGNITTTFVLTESLRASGRAVELIGTGETSWFQGAPFTLILDSIPAKYVPAELEALVEQAERERSPEILVFEGQGSVMDPDNVSGLALLTAVRPHALVLQHAPIHTASDGDPHGLAHVERHLKIYELLAGSSVIAIALSHEGLTPEAASEAGDACRKAFGLPVTDVIAEGGEMLASVVGERAPVGASAHERRIDNA